ncbi:Undecaprenyl pyrophosphate synthase 2 [Streptomyces davaonensis JCM 4913]|uniref:Isoprenyl transferase n=1 Tax=Streptomyces davaonensis (strain DSM 101723 / JCM 4913 / KCC S-0913 / 768) TaxID=1214101 RepID=K4RGM2_STRDJ|nr:isoprenyl transferase [Streptomyces davaonensis]CCK32344.1 Undecaprenyl pyrophosphate synthase 2 [Streptomyces davaonensis JCM 4913]
MAYRALRAALEAVYVKRLARKLDGKPRPRHVAIMLDGNRRWARGAGHDDVREGYRVGGAKVGDFLRWCDAADIEHVTLWMLSDDNLHRPPAELGPLLEIIEETVASICAADEDWRIEVIGALDLLPGETSRSLKDAVARTTGRTGLKVDVAVGYGGRREIIDAVRSAFDKHISAGGDPRELAENFDLQHISDNLYSPAGPDTDFIIRTSGEQRLSGFLLWQSAYAEVHFVEVLWPAFRQIDLLRALRSYAVRDRRYGR